MKRPVLLLSLILLAIPGFAQEAFDSLDPSREASVPTYLNAEVVRVDPATDSMTVRSASGDVVLTVDCRSIPGAAGYRAGDNVIMAYRTLVDEVGRPRRVVTYLLSASPASAEPGPAFASPAVPAGPTRSAVRRLRGRVSATPTTTVTQARLSGDLATAGPLSVATEQRIGPGVPVSSGAMPPSAAGTVSFPGGSPAPAGVVPAVGANPTGTLGSTGVGGPFAGGIAVQSAAPASPFANPVPSIPAPTPAVNAVLPPAVAKAPLSDEDVGALRAQGERDLDMAAVVLAMQANEIDAAWFRFKTACLGGFTAATTASREWFLLREGRVPTPTDDSCRASYSQLQGLTAGFEHQLGIAIDAARQADVLPGRMREILARHRLER